MSPSSRRVAALFVGALLAAPCTAVVAASQLFKCVDGGRTVYQQQACSPSTQPESAASAAQATARVSAAVTDPAASAPRRIRASSLPASAALATPR